MALRINEAIHADGQPLRVNGVQVSELKVNGVLAWVDTVDVELPQFVSNTHIGVWLEDNYPDLQSVRIINNLIQPRLNFAEFGNKTIEFVNNGEVRGTTSGDNALLIWHSGLKLINNGWIRGAGGAGGLGGTGGLGGNGGTGGLGGKGANVAATYNRSYTDVFNGHSPWTAWYEFKAEVVTNIYDNSASSTVNVATGPTTVLHGTSRFIRGSIRTDEGNTRTYGLTKDIETAPIKIGGGGGAGGSHGTVGGAGGAGGAGGDGQSFSRDRTNGVGGSAGATGNAGGTGAAGSPSAPAGGHSGGTGGQGGKKGDGGAGGAGGNGGDWGVDGTAGIVGVVASGGGTGVTGAQGHGGGDLGSAGFGGSNGGGGAAGAAGGLAGAGIIGFSRLTDDSVIGNVDGEIVD